LLSCTEEGRTGIVVRAAKSRNDLHANARDARRVTPIYGERASERIHGAGGMTLDAAAAAAAAAASLTSGADRWPLVSEWRSRRRRRSAV